MPLRPMGREQMWMLPPTLDELLPLDHPARFVAEFVDALDRDAWAELGVDIEGDSMGAPAYHPRALLSVWLYGFMTGVRSCRKLEAACRDQIPYLWLTGWQHPDHNTLWRFYKGNYILDKPTLVRLLGVRLSLLLRLFIGGSLFHWRFHLHQSRQGFFGFQWAKRDWFLSTPRMFLWHLAFPLSFRVSLALHRTFGGPRPEMPRVLPSHYQLRTNHS